MSSLLVLLLRAAGLAVTVTGGAWFIREVTSFADPTVTARKAAARSRPDGSHGQVPQGT